MTLNWTTPLKKATTVVVRNIFYTFRISLPVLQKTFSKEYFGLLPLDLELHLMRRHWKPLKITSQLRISGGVYSWMFWFYARFYHVLPLFGLKTGLFRDHDSYFFWISSANPRASHLTSPEVIERMGPQGRFREERSIDEKGQLNFKLTGLEEARLDLFFLKMVLFFVFFDFFVCFIIVIVYSIIDLLLILMTICFIFVGCVLCFFGLGLLGVDFQEEIKNIVSYVWVGREDWSFSFDVFFRGVVRCWRWERWDWDLQGLCKKPKVRGNFYQDVSRGCLLEAFKYFKKPPKDTPFETLGMWRAFLMVPLLVAFVSLHHLASKEGNTTSWGRSFKRKGTWRRRRTEVVHVVMWGALSCWERLSQSISFKGSTGIS